MLTVTKRYRGTLHLGTHGEACDVLILDDGESIYSAPFTKVISSDIEQYGGYLTVRYWTADKPCNDDAMIEGAIRELLGVGETEFNHAYSEITGYLWTDEEINVGGHDMLEELCAQQGRYCLLEITYSQEGA